MTREERDAAIAGAWANVEQKAARLDEAGKAFIHAHRMHTAAAAEWLDLLGTRYDDAEPSPLVTGSPWCAGNPALRTEEPV